MTLFWPMIVSIGTVLASSVNLLSTYEPTVDASRVPSGPLRPASWLFCRTLTPARSPVLMIAKLS